ncbi:hypothetical protein ABH927_005495 [Planotetraspora sp. GP83]
MNTRGRGCGFREAFAVAEFRGLGTAVISEQTNRELIRRAIKRGAHIWKGTKTCADSARNFESR